MNLNKLLCVLSSIILTSCSTTINYHGKLVEKKDISKIKINYHTKKDVFYILGSPTFESTIGSNKWFYLYKENATHLINKAKVIKKNTISVTFNNNDKVISIKTEIANNAKDINPIPHKTKTIDANKSLIKQALGNFGRFAGRSPK